MGLGSTLDFFVFFKDLVAEDRDFPELVVCLRLGACLVHDPRPFQIFFFLEEIIIIFKKDLVHYLVYQTPKRIFGSGSLSGGILVKGIGLEREG